MSLAGNRDSGPWGEQLWRHSAPESTAMWDFYRRIRENHSSSLERAARRRIRNSDDAPHSGDFFDLYDWSIDEVATFWGEVWQYCGIKASTPYTKVVARGL